MNQTATRAEIDRPPLAKAPTGIEGLDEITSGGLPRGRPTLICGGAGCGKTLLAVEFLVRGATEFGEPGVFIAFEESAEELSQNVRSLGFDLDGLVEENKLAIDSIRLERGEITETGDYDLEGLFVRLGFAIDSIGARRIVLDTIETLFGGLSNEAIVRSELRRLFRWLKDKGLTAIITAERGAGMLTRHGLEEYVSDCVILLDHRVVEQVSTRRLRIVKYRGSVHGNNEYPFLIEKDGISVLPITSVGLIHEASQDRVSSGIPRLDAMLGGSGYYCGSTVLVSGTAGTGKTVLAATFADAACRRGERCLYLSFEESRGQMVRNLGSVGIDLGRWIDAGCLRYIGTRPTTQGLETHLATLHTSIATFAPRCVIIDPISSFLSAGSPAEARSMLIRLVDYLKSEGITALFTNLTSDHSALEVTEVEISSLIDTWILLRDIETAGERNRGLYVLKSRGMAHSNQIREFRITGEGIDLIDVYTGPEGVLTGTARLTQEARERTAARARSEEIQAKRRELDRKRRALEASIASLREVFQEEEAELARAIEREHARDLQILQDQSHMARRRRADDPTLEPEANGSLTRSLA